MTPNPACTLTNKDRKVLQEELAFYLRDYPWSSSRLDHFTLERAMYGFEALGLKEFQGISYRFIKSVYDYIGHTFFRRSLSAKLGRGQAMSAPGLDEAESVLRVNNRLPTFLDSPALELRLSSLNDKKLLLLEAHTWTDWQNPVYFDPRRLVISLGPGPNDVSLLSLVYVTMHYLGTEQRKWRCWHCHNYTCKQCRSFDMEAEVNTAYSANGLTGLWHLLDKVWLDVAASRPMNKPLSQEALAIRCLVHDKAPIKVFTTDGAIVGELDETIRNSSEVIRGIRIGNEQWAPLGDIRRQDDIPASKILEIMPCRIEQESNIQSATAG